jgi:hypothetical protein
LLAYFFAKQIKEPSSVTVIQEYGLLPITSGGQMI